MHVALAIGALALAQVVLAAGEPAPGAVNASTVKLPDAPGSVRGLADSAEVSAFSAQVRYSVPIDLTPVCG